MSNDHDRLKESAAAFIMDEDEAAEMGRFGYEEGYHQHDPSYPTIKKYMEGWEAGRERRAQDDKSLPAG